MTYRDWVREGEQELARMGDPTEAEKRELLLELDRENAEQAEREEAEYAYGRCARCGVEFLEMGAADYLCEACAERKEAEMTQDTQRRAHADISPHLLVAGEFVELDEGTYVRAAAVEYVTEIAPAKDAGGDKTFLCNVVTNTGNWSVYPARTVLVALNLALENGRQRRVERAEY